jgi:dTDP-4-dehydrorhamnose 3,5-epimerase
MINVSYTDIEGVLLIKPSVFKDNRGYFFESFRADLYLDAGIDNVWVQDNQSSSTYGVIRGLHYQTGGAQQAKLVRVLQGKILDVILDVRPHSPTYGHCITIPLDDVTHEQVYIPRGCAHGFSVLSPQAVFHYKCDNYYHRDMEGGVWPLDPALAINWQIPEADQILSDKDKVLPPFGKHLPIQ